MLLQERNKGLDIIIDKNIILVQVNLALHDMNSNKMHYISKHESIALIIINFFILVTNLNAFRAATCHAI